MPLPQLPPPMPSADVSSQMPMLLPPPVESLASVLANLLALMRAVYEIEQSFHWRTRGPNFLAMHDLFARVYGTTYADIDGLAERIIGITGEQDAVDVVAQSAVTAQLVQSLNPSMAPEMFAASALAAEVQLMNAVVAVLDKQELLTDGLANFLQGVADKHEVSIYMLSQTIRT